MDSKLGRLLIGVWTDFSAVRSVGSFGAVRLLIRQFLVDGEQPLRVAIASFDGNCCEGLRVARARFVCWNRCNGDDDVGFGCCVGSYKACVAIV